MNNIYAHTGWMLLAFAGVLAVPAVAQKPDFSGTWRLNLARSFLGGEHPSPEYQLTKIIEQKSDEVTMTDISVHQTIVNIPMPDSKITNTLILDEKEREVKGAIPFPGVPAPTLMVSPEWQGGTLAITERGNSTEGATTTCRRYYLSSDGAELIELVESHSSYGDTEQRLVFERGN
jgi:hypothetical protein